MACTYCQGNMMNLLSGPYKGSWVCRHVNGRGGSIWDLVHWFKDSHGTWTDLVYEERLLEEEGLDCGQGISSWGKVQRRYPSYPSVSFTLCPRNFCPRSGKGSRNKKRVTADERYFPIWLEVATSQRKESWKNASEPDLPNHLPWAAA